MNKEILLVAEAISNEKGVPKEVIFSAIEQALATATCRRYDTEADICVTINQETGDYQTFRRWEVVADDILAVLGTQLTTEEALEKDPSLQVGDTYQEQVENVAFGRIAAQTAKQVIVQKVREAERAQVAEEYKNRIGELINGSVKKTTRDNVIVDFGNNAEGLLPRAELVGREIFRIGDRVRAILQAVRSETRGPQLLLSRSCNEMLVELFKIEVPEIAEGIVEICGAARDPGSRAKIAVQSNDSRVDPIATCIGMRGSRVQAVSGELDGEKIDIVLWDDNAAQLVINAMSPADIESIVVDEDTHTMDVAVDEENLAQAIGRNGQNVKLAKELTGWAINVMSSTEATGKHQQEAQKIIDNFINKLDIEKEVAEILVEEGFTTLEEVAYVPIEEMLEIEDFNEEIATELSERAKDTLLTQALASEEQADQQPADDLLAMEGMDSDLAYKLANLGIITMEDLAEKSVDDIESIEGLSRERAGELIMKARAPWFAEDKE